MSDDGIFDDEEVSDQRISNQTQSQTQPDVKNLISDIFGDSDEEEEVQQVKQLPVKPANYLDDDEDNIFADSDEDESNFKGRLQKKSAVTAPTSASKARVDEDNLLDSDDEDVTKAVQLAKKRKLAEKLQKENKKMKKKTHMLEPSSKKSSSSKRISSSSKIAKKSTEPSEAGNDKEASGDEYDSGEEAPETVEDRNFIDGEDDHADLLDEYNADNQHFDDERPDDDEWGAKKKKYKPTASSSSGGNYSSGAGSSSNKNLDPMSQTLAEMKNPKIKEMAEMEKELYVEKLQKKMTKAVQLDNEAFAKAEPAIHKLKLLPVIVQAFNMKALQNTLLERDILMNLRDFIEPRDAKTLCALAVRTAIYEILLRISCTPEQLKRTSNEKPPIGAVIVQLRKHKMETAENKRLLKELMDKWSRPIFAKSVDVRSNGGTTSLMQDNYEVQEALRHRYAMQAQQRSEAAEGGVSKKSVQLDALLTGGAEDKTTSSDYYQRARTPYSQGFLFTVQPELKSVDKSDLMEKSLGEGRMKLFKKMAAAGKSVLGDGLGRKVNPRAMDMAVSGRNVKA